MTMVQPQEAPLQPRERVGYFDRLNVLACFAVVVLHVNGAFWSFADDARWLENLLIESIFYPAVAIFFMLTGATLMDYRERYDTRTYFRKRVGKVFIPFLAWSLIAIGFHVLKGSIPVAQLTPRNLADWLLNCSYYNVYWFFAPLFACYLAIPFLSAIPREKRGRLFGYAAGFAFLTISLLPMVALWAGVSWNRSLQTPINGGYVMYVLLGYLLAQKPLVRWQRLTIYALGIGALVLRTVMTYYLSRRAGMVVYTYGDYVNFPCVFQALAVFTALRHQRAQGSPRVRRALRWLASASFTVFLVHKFVIDLLVRFGLEPSWLTGTLWYPLLWPFVVYGLSLCIYAVGKQIPGVRRLFP